MREMRQAHGDPPGAQWKLSGLHGISGVRRHARFDAGACGAIRGRLRCSRSAGAILRKMRQAHGRQTRTVRLFSRLQRLPGMPQHQTHCDGRGQVTAVEDKPLDEKCPECGSQLVIKHGRYGQFTACSNYPNCKFVKRQTLGIPCPEKGCSGEIVVRRTKRGKTFYGCTRYPECKFTAWDKPIAEPCPNCGSPILLEKVKQKSGPVRYCPNEACQYEHAAV